MTARDSRSFWRSSELRHGVWPAVRITGRHAKVASMPWLAEIGLAPEPDWRRRSVSHHFDISDIGLTVFCDTDHAVLEEADGWQHGVGAFGA